MFGSGANHAIYAQFMAKSCAANGRQVGLLGAGTRMATWFYAMIRLLRLRLPLQATIHQQQFLDLKLNGTAKAAVRDIADDAFWKSMYILLRAVYPALRALRYCDSSKPMMDKLYFLSRRTTEALKKSEQSLNNEDLFRGMVVDRRLQCEGTIVFGEDVIAEGEAEDVPVAIVQEEVDEIEDEDEEERCADAGGDGNTTARTDLTNANTLGRQLIYEWDRRSLKLNHDYAITGWALSVMDEVRCDVAANLSSEHREAIERVVERLHLPPCANPHPKVCGVMTLAKIVDIFWDEFNDFQGREGKFSNKGRWATDDVIQGRSHLWHQKYSLPHTEVLGFVACRVTSKLCGIGAAERSWGGVKTIKDGHRSHIESESLEKRAILYVSGLMHEARFKNKLLEKIDAGKNGMFSDDDIRFDLELEKFGVDLSELREPMPVNRIFRAWVEDMEVANRYRNDCLAEATIMEKYKNLVFMDMNPKSGTNGKVFSVLADNMEFRRGRGAGGGWRVIVVCADDDVDEQTFTLEEAIVNIGSTPQEDGIRIYHSREEEDEEE